MPDERILASASPQDFERVRRKLRSGGVEAIVISGFRSLPQGVPHTSAGLRSTLARLLRFFASSQSPERGVVSGGAGAVTRYTSS